MGRREVDKRTLHVLLEAVRSTEDRLRDYYRQMQDEHIEIPDLFRRQYGGVRRLKDYMMRCTDNFRTPMHLFLSEEDQNLLASCLVDNLPDVDAKLSSRRTKDEERPWLEEQQTLLLSTARELMTEPLQPILSANPLARQTSSVKSLMAALPGAGAMPLGDIRVGADDSPDGELPPEPPSEMTPAMSPQGYPNQPPPGYPHQPNPSGYPPSQHGYPPVPQPPGYPPSQHGYPPVPQQPGYPPAQHGYPPHQPAVPPQQQGYYPQHPPPQHPQHPQHPPPQHPQHPQHPPLQHPSQPPQQGYAPPPPQQAPAPAPTPAAPVEPPAAPPESEAGGLRIVPTHLQFETDLRPTVTPDATTESSSMPTGGGIPARNPLPKPAGEEDDSGQKAASSAGNAEATTRDSPGRPKEARVAAMDVDLLFDPNMVKDHRVRAQIRLDLQDLSRAQQNDDLRLSLVHLGSLLEGLLLDFGLEHRKDLDLTEGPDLWDFHALAVRVLSTNLDAGQEPVLGLLHACRRLLRPSCQVVHPIIATSSMVHDAGRFLKWCLAELGYEGEFLAPKNAPRAPSGKHKAELPSLSGVWKATKRGE